MAPLPSPPLLTAGEEAGAGCGEGEEADAGRGEGEEAGAGRGDGEEAGAGRGEVEDAGAGSDEGEDAGADRGEDEEAGAGRGEGEGCTLHTDGDFASEVSGTVPERFTAGDEFSREKKSLGDREGSPPPGDTVFEGGRETVRSGRAAGCAVWCEGRGEECGLDIVEDPSDISL